MGALLLFRLFDIAKPWPVNQLERSVSGGWGVVLDDVAAGVMAGFSLTALLIGLSFL
jgi:phosphatidylglycerophosphatase A